MSNERSEIDKTIDNVSGSTNRNERTWAVASGATAAFFTGGNPYATFVGARVGASVGHGAQQAEKTIRRVFGF